MNTVTEIRGVPVQFPFPPYDIQKEYMGKVIECLQNESIAVLESPTGTGKTLSLLCSSLAWLQLKKTQLQAQLHTAKEVKLELDEKAGNIASSRMFLGVPTIIYASRTHSQLSQAMQELRRSSYSHMRASVLGSRDQLCIHPEVKAEQEATRLQMCRLKRNTRSCHYHNRVDISKNNPAVCEVPVLDIEDMIKLGTKYTFCPYYMTKGLKQKADIIFAPYNYLLDPLARKSLGLELKNAVVIIDEGHNIEKVCEESASVEVKTTDLLLAISELDVVMKYISETPMVLDETAKDIHPDDVANFKQMLLNLTEVVHEIPMTADGDNITSYPGDYMFEILGKSKISEINYRRLIGLIDDMIQFLASQGNGPFARKGKGLQLFSDFLNVVFASNGSKERIQHCYKVHIKQEEQLGKRKGAVNTWLSARDTTTDNVRVLSFWCFSSGFGMELITREGIKALILTSGTLAPLKPLISELNLNVRIRLENPHIIKQNQICVKIVSAGPDGEPLNSSFQNRNNPKYVSSLGRAIVTLSRIVPSGLLIFFPSYPIMQKCQEAWQAEGIWTDIMAQKAIFVEPKGKDAFNEAMTGYYEKINDPNLKGAIFMAVCRGKVSEGLDFADANGRAVIITGLPYPPLKDPKVILKRRYLDQCHAKDKEFLTGSDWYSLEASRAVNQAIGRVIRHRHDYGAIILLDQRFTGFRIKERMSKWLRGHLQVASNYGEVIRDLSQFFRKAQSQLPVPEKKLPINPPSATFETPQTYTMGNFNFGTSLSTSVISNDSPSTDDSVHQYLGTTDNPNGSVTIHSTKRQNSDILTNAHKKNKIALKLSQRIPDEEPEVDKKSSNIEYCIMVKKLLKEEKFKQFSNALAIYHATSDLKSFLDVLWSLFPSNVRYIFTGLTTYIKANQRSEYKEFLIKHNLTVLEDF